MEVGEAGDQRGAPIGFEFRKAGAVDDAGDQFADVERASDVGRDDAQQLPGIIHRFGGSAVGSPPGFGGGKAAQDLPCQADAVTFLFCEVIADAADAAVHFGATQGFFVDDLVGSHFHKRRTGEEDPGFPFNENGIIGHSRHIGPACGSIAEDHRDRRQAGFRSARNLAEAGTAVVEDRVLFGQVGPCRFDEVDYRQGVLHGDLRQAQAFLQGGVVDRSTFVGPHVGDEHAQAPRHQADAAHLGAAGTETFAAEACQWQQFQEGAIAVETQFQALPGKQFALSTGLSDMAVLSLRPAFLHPGMKVFDQRAHDGFVIAVLV